MAPTLRSAVLSCALLLGCGAPADPTLCATATPDGGISVLTCASETTCCLLGGCVALAADPRNCGICGKVCEGRQTCRAGKCAR